MPNQFLSPEGDIENYFVTEYWLIDQYIGDELWTWGFAGPQNGNASATMTTTPVTTFAGGNNWKQVSSTAGISVRRCSAIKSDGTLWIWGDGSTAALGINDTTNRSTPVTTFAGGTNWKQVNNGFYHTTAIKTDGTLWVWGEITSGRTGTGAVTGHISTPVTTFAGGTDWKQVSAGNAHTAAIKTDGTLWIWGLGTNGRLGNGVTTGNISTPITTFAGGTNWKQVSCGQSQTIALKTDGTLWVWGNGTGGKLGNASTNSVSTPVTTFAGGTNWKQVSTGYDHCGAIKTDGTLYMWGVATNGRLGNNSTSPSRSTPVTTSTGGTNWKQICCGRTSTVALKTDGVLWGWGNSSANQLIGAGGNNPLTCSGAKNTFKQVSFGDVNGSGIVSGISPDLSLS